MFWFFCRLAFLSMRDRMISIGKIVTLRSITAHSGGGLGLAGVNNGWGGGDMAFWFFPKISASGYKLWSLKAACQGKSGLERSD
jgi:hypothetical protein